MYCNACGKTIAEDVRFCSYCGTVVGIAPTPNKLMRSRADKKIAGVCAGLAHHFDLDVTLVRILCIFVTLATGVCPGIVTYLLAWILVPAEARNRNRCSRPNSQWQVRERRHAECAGA